MSSIPQEFRADVNALPATLRALLDEELAAGNSIQSVSYTHPAPPIGACVMLAKPVSTRARATDEFLTFRRVQGSQYSASFTDADARYFILEAPLESDAAYPDMDAIRKAHEVKNPDIAFRAATAPVDRFQAAMHVDYEKWHDGVGYDLRVLAEANDDERKIILAKLIPPSAWRDVEALAAMDSDVARAALHKALTSGNAEVRAAVTRYAPAIGTERERTETLLDVLKHGAFFEGLTSALDQVEQFHPPAIVNALFAGLFVRPGEIATNFAGMLAFIHGKADSSFDWALRPLFLKFNSDDGAERERAFVELCGLLELNPADVKKRIAR